MDVYDNIIFNSEMIISAAFLFPKKFREEISNEFLKDILMRLEKVHIILMLFISLYMKMK